MRYTLRSAGRLVLIGVLLIALSGPVMSSHRVTRAQAAPPATAEYVPASALLYLAIDTRILSRQWRQTAVLAERLDASMDPEVVASGILGDAFGSDVSIDVTPFIGGELALVALSAGSLVSIVDPDEALLDPAGSAEDLADGMVVVALPSNLAAAEAELLRALEVEAGERGVEPKESAYRGTTIRYVEADVASGLPGVAIAVVGEAIALAANPAQLEPIIDRGDGANDPITAIGGFDDALAAMPGERIAFGLLNGPSLMADSLAIEGIGPAIEAFIPGGANGVTAFALSSQADGFRVDTRTVSGDGEPIRSFGEHFESELFANLPAETQVAVNGSDFAGTRLLDGVLSILFMLLSGIFVDTVDQPESGSTPQPLPSSLDETTDAAYQLISAFLGVDFEANFVDLLDGEFLFGLWNAGGPYSNPAAGFVSRSSDAATIDRTLSALTLVVSLLFGAETSTSPTGATRIELGGGPIDIDVVDDSLVIGYGGAGEALLASPRASLQASPLYEAVTAPLPDERSLMIYVNIGALQEGAAPARPRDLPGLIRTPLKGPAFAFVTFNDGDEMGGQGFLYIPEPD